MAQSSLILYDPMDCGPQGSSVHGILQARILELPFPSPGDLPNPGINSRSPALQVDSLTVWATSLNPLSASESLSWLIQNIDYRYFSFRAASSYQANQRACTEERTFAELPAIIITFLHFYNFTALEIPAFREWWEIQLAGKVVWILGQQSETPFFPSL